MYQGSANNVLYVLMKQCVSVHRQTDRQTDMCVCATFMCSLVCTPRMLNHGMCSFMQQSMSRLLSFYVFLYLLIFTYSRLFCTLFYSMLKPFFNLEHTYFYLYYIYGTQFFKRLNKTTAYNVYAKCDVI